MPSTLNGFDKWQRKMTIDKIIFPPEEWGLQITYPPLMMRVLVFVEPLAGEIHCYYYKKPDEINAPKIETKSSRSKEERNFWINDIIYSVTRCKK